VGRGGGGGSISAHKNADETLFMVIVDRCNLVWNNRHMSGSTHRAPAGEQYCLCRHPVLSVCLSVSQ
jgi:hypothetical protein